MINKERIRQRLANINNRNGPNSYWSCPKEGKATIRMFPYPYGDGDPFLEYFFHFNIGHNNILCPLKNGLSSECPICEVATDLYNSNDPADKEASKKLYARSRYFGTVLDRADETLTGKYWGFSQGLLIKFSTWLEEDGGDYENFMDFDEGLDLTVFMERSPNKTFPAVMVEPKRRESPLAKSKEDLDAILKSVKPASEMFTPLTTEQIQAKLDEWLNSEDAHTAAPADDSAGVVKGGNGKKEAPAEEKPEKKRRVAKDIEDVFAENFPDA